MCGLDRAFNQAFQTSAMDEHMKKSLFKDKASEVELDSKENVWSSKSLHAREDTGREQEAQISKKARSEIAKIRAEIAKKKRAEKSVSTQKEKAAVGSKLPGM